LQKFSVLLSRGFALLPLFPSCFRFLTLPGFPQKPLRSIFAFNLLSYSALIHGWGVILPALYPPSFVSRTDKAFPLRHWILLSWQYFRTPFPAWSTLPAYITSLIDRVFFPFPHTAFFFLHGFHVPRRSSASGVFILCEPEPCLFFPL